MNLSLLLVMCLWCPVFMDIYLHNPRGSNNRLNEKSATRAQNNRAFDSQNNQRGGYNVGDSGNAPFKAESEQYQMKYYQSGANSRSVLSIEWTDQHGCGSDDQDHSSKQNCALILQYMCQPLGQDETNLDRIRDGLTTSQQPFTQMAQDTFEQNSKRKQNDVKMDRVLQEPWQYYDNCYYRQRNMGLFTADQILKKNNKGYSSGVHTRQNPNGARSGYECPEERDYYPYWHPTPWKDIAILTSDTSMCDYYQSESFNQKSKFLCVEFYDDKKQKHWSKWNNKNDCEQNGGKWTEFFNYLDKATEYKDERSCNSKANQKWALAYDSPSINEKECLIVLAKPECRKADWTRSNHLGNGLDGKAPSYDWILPYFMSNKAQKCVLRIRYNISTDDYASNLDAKANGLNSPVKTNPQVNMQAGSNQVLKLAINTAQYGRVFQDRSHSFVLLPRPSQINAANIYNLNIRGKRGNIVQVYPGVEYDFVPNELTIGTNDLVHVQWTGSNTHNNAQPAGDGQAGAEGQGQDGTDRNNFAQISSLNDNYPIPAEKADIWKDAEAVVYLDETIKPNSNKNGQELALYLASSGYYKCLNQENCQDSYATKSLLDADLNNAPASCPGVLIKFKKSNKSYHYMSTRNNNFSNRSQKGTINVKN